MYHKIHHIADINNNINVQLKHDINGNIYLVTDTDKYYTPEIDNQNNLTFYDLFESALVPCADNIDGEFKRKKIRPADEKTLKQSVLVKVSEEPTNDEDEDVIGDEKYQNYKKRVMYEEEEMYYDTEDDVKNKNKDQDCDDECDSVSDSSGSDNIGLDIVDTLDTAKFVFYTSAVTKNTIQQLDKYCDALAIYDTYVRDSDKNVITSFQLDEGNAYRLSIYDTRNVNKNMTMDLNVIGSEITSYNIVWNTDADGNVILIANKINMRQKY